MPTSPTNTVLIVPDLHCPYQHPGAVDFLADVKRRYRPRSVVCIGDEIDAHALARWTPDPDLDGPGVELAKASAALKPLYKLFPSVSVCESNHTLRPWKKAREAGLPGALLRSVGEIVGAPAGWRWAPWHRLAGVLYTHGDGYSGFDCSRRAATAHRCPVVMGHVHSAAGVWHAQGYFDRVWGLSVGCLIDPDSPAFSYGRYHAARPVLGCGVIVDGVPQFVPMN